MEFGLKLILSANVESLNRLYESKYSVTFRLTVGRNLKQRLFKYRIKVNSFDSYFTANSNVLSIVGNLSSCASDILI